MNTASRELPYQLSRVVKISRRAIDGMDYYGVTHTQMPAILQVEAIGIFAGSFVGEGKGKRYLIQLPFRIMAQSAHTDIANALTEYHHYPPYFKTVQYDS